jgi:YVTN family beta-propeller protein
MRVCHIAIGLAALLTATAAPAVERAYVTSGGTRSVAIIDTATNSLTGTVDVSSGGSVQTVVPSHDGTRAWVASYYSHLVIDPSTATITSTFSSYYNTALAIDRKDRTLFSAAGSTVNVFDADTSTYLGSLYTNGWYNAAAVLLAPDGQRLYVVNGANFGLQVFSLSVLPVTPSFYLYPTASLPVSNGRSAALTSNGDTLYAASFSTVYAVDTATATITDQADLPSSGLVAIAPDDSVLYLARSGALLALDPLALTELQQVQIPNDPSAIAVHPTNGRVYVTDLGTDSVHVYDGSTLAAVTTIAVGDSPNSIAIGGCPGPAGDCDGDGVVDGADNCTLASNSAQTDGDGDALGDACDNCPADSNPLQDDPDRNDIGTACQDLDGDGVVDAGDNCVGVANAGQDNADGDIHGDACDVCPGSDDAIDADFDTWSDGCDNCPTLYNYGQEDGNFNGTGDRCEDRDGDSVLDYTDNCPDTVNAGQENEDEDSEGDACDDCSDADFDGFGDPGHPGNVCPDDNCPSLPNPDQTDADNDLVGDLCAICTPMGDAKRFAVLGVDSVKWKTGAAYYARYPTTFTTESDVCATKVNGRAGNVYYDVVATEPLKRAATILDKSGDYSEYANVYGSLMTGGGDAVVSDFTVNYFIDTSGNHPDVQLCRDAKTDAKAASAYFASLPPTQTIDELILRPDQYSQTTELTVNGSEVVNVNTLIIDGKAGQWGCRRYTELLVNDAAYDPNTTVVINVFDKFKLGDCGYVTNYVGGLEQVIINVVGSGSAVKVAPSAWSDVPILAPGRSVQVKGAKNFEEPTFVEPIWANKLKLLGYVCANTIWYDGQGYCGAYAEDAEPFP